VRLGLAIPDQNQIYRKLIEGKNRIDRRELGVNGERRPMRIWNNGYPSTVEV